MRIKGAVFDFDGTLFDSMPVWESLGERYLLSLGIRPAADVKDRVREMSLFQAACYLREEYALDLSPEEIRDGINRLIRDFYFYEVLPKRGAHAFLERLTKEGIRLCIATASDRAQIEAALKRCSMERFFERIFTCTEVGHGKDEPHIFREAAAYFDAKPEETLGFEDALHAARTAAEAGFPVVGVFDSSEPREEELRALCVCYLSDFEYAEELMSFLPG